MHSDDLLPSYAPPAGGLTELMRRLDKGDVARRRAVRRNAFVGSLLIGGLAATLAIVMLPRSTPSLADLVQESKALHVYKYRLKSMPVDEVLIVGPDGAQVVLSTTYGYRSEPR